MRLTLNRWQSCDSGGTGSPGMKAPGADTIPQELLDPGMNGDGAGLGAHVLFRKNARQSIV